MLLDQLTPILAIRHEDHSLTAACPLNHRLGMSARKIPDLRSYNSFTGFLELSQMSISRSRSEYFPALFRPALQQRYGIIPHLLEGLVDSAILEHVEGDVQAGDRESNICKSCTELPNLTEPGRRQLG